MFWCLVRLSTGALCGGLYANPLEMAIQSAVACSEAKINYFNLRYFEGREKIYSFVLSRLVKINI